MKTKELIEELNAAGFNSYTNNHDTIVISTKNMKFNICINKKFTRLADVKLDLSDAGMTLRELAKLSQLLLAYAETPVDERKDEPKYRVRLCGFNSDNGHQYLTAQNDDVKATKIFACAPNSGLKQEFTLDELNTIANRNEFKAVPWIQDLLRNAEEVDRG